MFELPDYTGKKPDFIANSLNFWDYHVTRTMQGNDRKTAREKVRAKAKEYGITLEEQNHEEANDHV